MPRSNNDAGNQGIYQQDGGRGVGAVLGGLAGAGALVGLGALALRRGGARANKALARASERGMSEAKAVKMATRYAKQDPVVKATSAMSKPFSKIKNQKLQSAAMLGSAAGIGGLTGALLDDPND